MNTATAQAREGDVVTYQFGVTNTGDVVLSGVSVDDDVLGARSNDNDGGVGSTSIW